MTAEDTKALADDTKKALLRERLWDIVRTHVRKNKIMFSFQIDDTESYFGVRCRGDITKIIDKIIDEVCATPGTSDKAACHSRGYDEDWWGAETYDAVEREWK